ncbi:thiamine pyrophosphate-binding protein [Xanthobacteraceae bacterium Astr-EGSB]|uniref:thiamine pyrophosphate-binding protein n=1 Tax=Astrobacterium formosum TaxID=3069710 RepID=UPI0027B7621A|nr:thiamine pyrophosphate-binding protein [Xanthobacteraceae bacterium Astr-EGSB]
MTGAEYIAEFLARVGSNQVHLLTGGACAFLVDAVARHPELRYTCFQHEQSAAMAADAVWRTSGKVGVAMATSGPGATNLITGIACSYFDSIPTIHITGQVNQREGSAYHGANVRQSGFQETKIAEMVRPITKYAVMVTSGEELRRELAKAFEIATEGRRGPVLLDVPMDVQQVEIEGDLILPKSADIPALEPSAVEDLQQTLSAARRPVVLWGGGVGLAGVEDAVLAWLGRAGLPFVSSWAGLTYFDHDHAGFVGQIGVYGNRGANFVLQNADTVIVLGSRLDNRQRSGNSRNFACGATVHVVDVDEEELKKYRNDGYRATHLDFRNLPQVLAELKVPAPDEEWGAYVGRMKGRYFGKETSSSAQRLNTLSPYDVVRKMNEVIDHDAIVIGDTGAAICWLHQAFKVKAHRLFTAGGNSPMGYAVPAAIGAKLEAPTRQVVSYNGDGGFQLNLQELQTIKHLDLDIAIVVMNNGSYGIIKQFQDSYLEHRYSASRDGYSTPDFGKVAEAYGLRYARIERIDQITPDLFSGGAIVIDVMLSEHTLIEPKLEMGRPINDQFPYLPGDEYEEGNRFVAYPRPESMRKLTS